MGNELLKNRLMGLNQDLANISVMIIKISDLKQNIERQLQL